MRVMDIKLAFASMFQRFWNCTSGTVFFPIILKRSLSESLYKYILLMLPKLTLCTGLTTK
jgi:hypothetical protein